MMKSRIGLSVGAFGAIIYFAALFGGYIPAVLLAGYVMLVEDNLWLRRTAVKALMTLVLFSIILAIISLVPDALDWIATIARTFEGKFEYNTVSLIFEALRKIVTIIRTIYLLVLGAKAFEQGTVTVPFVDRFLNRHL